jgi:hypothetical protein
MKEIASGFSVMITELAPTATELEMPPENIMKRTNKIVRSRIPGLAFLEFMLHPFTDRLQLIFNSY